MSDSYSHVFKQSLNAFHNGLISGGSSGGEGALIGARASIIGVGTDISGSVRTPDAIQDLYRLSPLTGRVPFNRSADTTYIVPPVAGPVCTSLISLETFMEGLLAAEPRRLDPMMVPVGWRKDLTTPTNRPLRIGYYLDDVAVRVQSPCEEAVEKIATALSAAGHEVFHWDTSSHKDAYYNLWEKAVLADGGRRCCLMCEKANGPLVEGKLVSKPEDELGVVEAEGLHQKIRDYQRNYMARWELAKLDALIMPILTWVGFTPKTWVKSSRYCGYTALLNLLDWAGLSVPMGRAKPSEIDMYKESGDGTVVWADHQPRDESDRFNYAQYDPTLIDGMPVNIQIVRGRYGEERTVVVAKALREAMSL